MGGVAPQAYDQIFDLAWVGLSVLPFGSRRSPAPSAAGAERPSCPSSPSEWIRKAIPLRADLRNSWVCSGRVVRCRQKCGQQNFRDCVEMGPVEGRVCRRIRHEGHKTLCPAGRHCKFWLRGRERQAVGTPRRPWGLLGDLVGGLHASVPGAAGQGVLADGDVPESLAVGSGDRSESRIL